MLSRHCHDHFAIRTNTELLCCTPKINIMVYTNYILVKQKIINKQIDQGVRCIFINFFKF